MFYLLTGRVWSKLQNEAYHCFCGAAVKGGAGGGGKRAFLAVAADQHQHKHKHKHHSTRTSTSTSTSTTAPGENLSLVKWASFAREMEDGDDDEG